jgi:hypothetical protein
MAAVAAMAAGVLIQLAGTVQAQPAGSTLGASSNGNVRQSWEFLSTGGNQSLTVSAGVDSVTVDAIGGKGGDGGDEY